MKIIPKIDIHSHAVAFPDYFPKYPWSGERFVSADELIGLHAELNIQKGVLLPLVSPEAQLSLMTSEACKSIADAHPDKFYWFCNVDPRALNNDPGDDLSYLLEHYKSLGAKGLGEFTANLPPDDPMVDNLFSRCEECGLPVLIHVAARKGGMYGLVDEIGLPGIERLLKRHPKLTLIGHSQTFWAELSSDITEGERNGYPTGKVTEGRLSKLLREYGNLYCDLSAGSGCNAMTRDPDFTLPFIEEFSDRIMYGCDICAPSGRHPFTLDAFLTKQRESGGISEENYVKLVRGNAIRLLGLDE